MKSALAGLASGELVVILYARMWIEMIITPTYEYENMTSSSMRGCGLKYFLLLVLWNMLGVILYARMWIEINRTSLFPASVYVILYARMWIEIMTRRYKFYVNTVILYARMWIEISRRVVMSSSSRSHPLCEDVD